MSIALLAVTVYVLFALGFLFFKHKFIKDSTHPRIYLVLILITFLIGIGLLFYSI